MKKLKTETKLWIESTIPDYTRVNIEISALSGHNWFEYFLADVDSEALDKFISWDYKDIYDFIDHTDFTLIQMLIAKLFKDNNIKLSDITDIDLFINDYGDGCDESYCLYEAYLICHSNKKVDYIIKVDSDYYDGYSENYERAELEAII